MNTRHNADMNAYVIKMRRDRAFSCIRSLRRYRKSGELSRSEMMIVAITTRGAITDYRQTVKAILGQR